MTAIPGPTLRAYAGGGIIGLAAGLAIGHPAPALLGTALLALAVLGLAGAVKPEVTVAIDELVSSVVEGETTDFIVRVAADQVMGRTYLDLGLEGLEIVEVQGATRIGGSALAVTVTPDVSIVVRVRATGWGRASVGPIRVYSESLLGMFDLRYEAQRRHSVIALPDTETVRSLLSPLETNLHVGDLVSTLRGTGSEFADLRQFRHGDDPRSVNWRVSSRAGSLWVNERHPERNGDVLLLVDAQVEAGTELETLVDRSVRMAAALVWAHARHHHRIGLITLDGLCRWITPGMGEQHRRRLLEQLIGVSPGEVIWEAAERAVIRAARRPAMVIALTSLMDPNLGGLLHVLRRAGIDISVVTLDVEPALPPPLGRSRLLGRRIWAMERELIRGRLTGEGIPVVTWRAIDPPDVPLAALAEMRTRWRRHA